MPFSTLTRRALALRCVLCGKDDPFTGLFSMQRHCRRCGYVYERERGYFLGSAEVNFWITFCILVPMVLCGFLFLEDPGWKPVWVCMTFVVLFPVWFFRYAKTLYMAIDLSFDPPTEADFAVRDEERS